MSQLAALALFAGVCNAFETPTRQSIFVQLLERREDLPNAIAMNSILMNGTRLVGPSLGGVLIAAFGETVCFALNAVSYLAVLVALAKVRVVHPRSHARRQPPAGRPRRGLALRDGDRAGAPHALHALGGELLHRPVRDAHAGDGGEDLRRRGRRCWACSSARSGWAR